jgi:Holliday junction DNA helicase RuvA
MISSLSGPVLDVSATSALIDCAGVGYEAFCPVRTLAQLVVGKPARLFTVLHVREDALTLFGFSTAAEKAFFVQLTNVSGVGPKIGLSLLSTFMVDDIRQAISLNQPATLARASGVGKKLAEKIIVELKDKMGALPLLATPAGLPASSIVDVASALTNLGYLPKIAEAAAAEALKAAPTASFDELFRSALRHAAG